MTSVVSMAVAILIRVESNGDWGAVGDGGRSVGLTQISPAIVADCNRIYPQYEFTLRDRYDPFLNIEMATIWLSREASRRRIADPRKLCYRWNAPKTGSPSKSYIRKIQKEYDRICPRQ